MTSSISQNTGIVAAKAVQNPAGTQAQQSSSGTSQSQVNAATQVAAAEGSVKISISAKDKAIQHHKTRAEGSSDSEENQQEAEVTTKQHTVRNRSYKSTSPPPGPNGDDMDHIDVLV